MNYVVSVIAVCLICQVSGYSLDDHMAQYATGIAVAPVNAATLVGVKASLNCQASDTVSRIFWNEFATTGKANPLSDGTGILPGAANGSRYHISQGGDRLTYTLNINSSLLIDGGQYQCYESSSGQQVQAELVVLATDPQCSTTMSSDGVAIEGQTFTAQCSIVYEGLAAPVMTWTGPAGFTVNSTTTNTTVHSTISFTVSRSMTGAQYVCKTNFTAAGFANPIRPNTALNAPDYLHSYVGPTLNVYVSTANLSTESRTTYIRWGRNVCPNSATVLYKGYAAGNYFSYSGGGGDYQCLPGTPKWGTVFNTSSTYGAYLYGVEYETDPSGSSWSNANNGGVSINNYDAVCSVCMVNNRSSTFMFPATTTCPAGWNLEYTGYLAGQAYASQYRNVHVCVDETPEVIPGSGASVSGAGFYTVQVRCGPLPCPSYADGWEVACAVCTI